MTHSRSNVIRAVDMGTFEVEVFGAAGAPMVKNHRDDEERWTFNGATEYPVHSVRTALTTANSTALTTAEGIDDGIPTFGNALLRAIRRRPANTATIADVSFDDEIAAENLVEGVAYTGNQPTTQSGGQLPPKHTYADVPVTQQWLRQSGNDSLIRAGLSAANGKLIEAEAGSVLASHALIPSVSTALSRSTLVTMMEDVSDHGPTPSTGIWLASPAAWRKCALLQENNNYLANGNTLLDRPVLVSPGIPENLGVGEDETCLLFGDPRAITMWLWGVYELVDRISKKKRGIIEYAQGAFYRVVVPQPKRLRRLTGIATT